MKRLSIIAVTAIAALLSASCNKSIETPMVPAPQDSIILDLNIAGFEGAGDTKAVKKGWADGDKLNLWFDDWNFNEKVNNPTPDLVITYDGSKSQWTAGKLAAGRSLKPNGKFAVLYEGFNDLTKYESKFDNGSQVYRAPSELINGTRTRQNNIVYYKHYLDYTYADNKLTATISDWETYSGVKILVKGLNHAEAANYGLCAKNTTAGEYLDEIGGLSIDPQYVSSEYFPKVFSLSGNYRGYVLGVPDVDGVAFYYRYADFTNADIEFRLFKKNASGDFEQTAKAPKFTGKTLVTDDKKIFGIVIDKSKFE